MQWDASSAFIAQRDHGPVSDANDHFLHSEPAGSVEEPSGLHAQIWSIAQSAMTFPHAFRGGISTSS